MLSTFVPNIIIPFSLPEDTDPKTVFQLARLDAALHAVVLDDSSKVAFEQTTDGISRSVQINRNARQARIVRFGLRGWSDLTFEDGSPAPFKPEYLVEHVVPNVGLRKGLSDEGLTVVGRYIDRIADRLDELHTPSEQDEKNSDSPSK